MLRSPALGAAADPQPALVHNPPPTRPRSLSLPSSPGPIELPGSILQDNQGYPESHTPAPSATSHPVAYHTQQDIQPPDRLVEDDDDPTYLLELLPRPLNHAKSVPSLVSQYSTMRPTHNGTRAASSGTAPTSNPMKMRHGESRTSAVSERTGRRDDVSIDVCFYSLRCLLVEFPPHEETVSGSFVLEFFRSGWDTLCLR
jgi:hypothetical protein